MGRSRFAWSCRWRGGIRLLRRLLRRDAAPSSIGELDVDFYRSLYPDLRLFTETEARLHYVTSGCKEGRFPNLKACEQSGVAIGELDVDFYRSLYPDLRLFTESEARLHYVTSGCKEGRFPNLKAREQSGGLAELPPKPAEGAKTDINTRVLRDAELSLRLLGVANSKPGKD
jgi:hypothetical protein